LDEDSDELNSLLLELGFEKEEIREATDELNAYKGIPGTTLKKYVNRALSSISDEGRRDFLKGLIVGMAVRKVEEALLAYDQGSDGPDL
jgi:hypothetical protein